MTIQLLNNSAIAEKSGRSPSWFRKWRGLGKFQEGIHYFRTGATNCILWNGDLVIDRIANWNNDSVHQRAIDNFVMSMPSNQRRAKSKVGSCG
jgi:hypothetical protein